MNKQEKIKQVKKLLDLGYTIKIYGNNNGNGKIWLYDNYIMFQNFGQSAVKNNLKDLTWLINTIFEAKRKDFNFSII